MTEEQTLKLIHYTSSAQIQITFSQEPIHC